jgi:hypothetical protein
VRTARKTSQEVQPFICSPKGSMPKEGGDLGIIFFPAASYQVRNPYCDKLVVIKIKINQEPIQPAGTGSTGGQWTNLSMICI